MKTSEIQIQNEYETRIAKLETEIAKLEEVLTTCLNPNNIGEVTVLPPLLHGYINVRIDLQISLFSSNKKISIPCTVNSYSKPNVSWKFKRRLIRLGPRMKVNTSSSILL